MFQTNLKQDLKDKNDLYRNRIIYSLPVRAGEWLNVEAIQTQKEFFYAYRKDHCQLLIQKTQKMLRNLLRPTTLSPETPNVYYNENYQIKSYGVLETTPCGSQVLKPLYLTGVITEKDIESTQHFVHGCSITASPNASPCVRNTFVFVGCDNKEKTGAVNYGEDVLIQIKESGGSPLYVQCENSTIDTFGSHLHLRLSQVPDIYCRFKIYHWKPQVRYETTGTFVHYNSYVIVQHSASGRNLAAEFNRWLPTFFGSECMVSCHNYQDTHRMETAENLWRIVGTDNPSLLTHL